jgi:hypothetical protein
MAWIKKAMTAIGIVAALGGSSMNADAKTHQNTKTQEVRIEFFNKADGALKQIEKSRKTLDTKKFFTKNKPTYADFIDAQNFFDQNIYKKIAEEIFPEINDKKERMSKAQARDYHARLNELREYILDKIARPKYVESTSGTGTDVLRIVVKVSVTALSLTLTILEDILKR